MTKPFRWTIAKREQLGTWPDHGQEYKSPNPAFLDELRTAAARILALSNGANLAFIGRTPENFFDYLSGAFAGRDGLPSLHLVQYSLRWAGAGGVDAIEPDKRAALHNYFCAEGVDPATIATTPRPFALVDFIASGGTMESLCRLLKQQAYQAGVDWNAVQRRLMIIGLTTRGKNSPNQWRWQHNQDWLGIIPDVVIKNVSVPWDFILPLANTRPKVTKSNHPGRWGEEEGRQHPPSADQIEALALALHLFDTAQTNAERRALAAEIAGTHHIRQAATRALVLELKR